MSAVEHKNPYILEMKEDVLYHLGLGTGTHNLPEMFGDIKFVCMGGTPHRMETFANYLIKELNFELPTGSCLQDISKQSHRYAMFKVGPVLSISHGMGVPSLSILLHEVLKLLAHAGAKDPIFFRIGTSGGIGLEGGTVIVTDEAVDGMLRPMHDNIVLGRVVSKPALLDSTVVRELVEIGKEFDFPTVRGKTLCTDDFYEGQGRLDGAFCDFTINEKLSYLHHLNQNGVRNIEMEATAFAALTHQAGVRAAIVCVSLLNRLNGDQILSTKESLQEFQFRPQRIVARYIKRHLPPTSPSTPKCQFAQAAKNKQEIIRRFTSYEDDKNFLVSGNGSPPTSTD